MSTSRCATDCRRHVCVTDCRRHVCATDCRCLVCGTDCRRHVCVTDCRRVRLTVDVMCMRLTVDVMCVGLTVDGICVCCTLLVGRVLSADHDDAGKPSHDVPLYNVWSPPARCVCAMVVNYTHSNRAPVENLITMFWVLCTITMKKKQKTTKPFFAFSSGRQCPQAWMTSIITSVCVIVSTEGNDGIKWK